MDTRHKCISIFIKDSCINSIGLIGVSIAVVITTIAGLVIGLLLAVAVAAVAVRRHRRQQGKSALSGGSTSHPASIPNPTYASGRPPPPTRAPPPRSTASTREAGEQNEQVVEENGV